MKIVVVGGTGLIGTKVVKVLAERGHQIVVASPKNGVDSVTGQGVRDAVAGASVVIDVSNSPANDGAAAMQFFTTSGLNLLAAEITSGVRHHVALSIVGADRVPGQGYYEAKVAQERLIAASGIAFTVVRSTQFFEFLGGLADAGTIEGVVRVPLGLLQPVAADDVAAYLVEIALGEPQNRIVEIAGPERASFEEIVRRYLEAIGDARIVVGDPEVRYFGGRLAESSLIPLGEVRLGSQCLNEWQRRPAKVEV
ncbi:MAG: SDR family oxidoreductase [Sphingomonas sp.]|jgi:uncharacterized protein YbjT (DUF2867 family)|uniref:SDR family oxidoreductase n=1 Tax=Sphingomonas sp. TaxID=28214 RepID=UPI00356AE9BE